MLFDVVSITLECDSCHQVQPASSRQSYRIYEKPVVGRAKAVTQASDLDHCIDLKIDRG